MPRLYAQGCERCHPSSRPRQNEEASTVQSLAALTFTARRSGNRVLDALSAADLTGLEDQLQIIEMRAHQSSLSAGLPMGHVHFPIDAVLSTLVTLNGRSVEVGTIGNES